MHAHESLLTLVHDCVGRIQTAKGSGSGFFVAPDTLLTCAHVVNETRDIRLIWQGQSYVVEVLDIHTGKVAGSDIAYPDLALLRVVGLGDHPCVLLDEEVQLADPLYSFGYPDLDHYPGGSPVTFHSEGWLGGDPVLLKLKDGQARPGLSGAPLLNRRTHQVCGIVKRTRGADRDLGAYAIPVPTVWQCFPELQAQQQAFHQRDARWRSCMLPPAPHDEHQRNRPPLQLPRRVEHFTDRQQEQQWLREQLAPGKVVTICGPGGMGKTALVAEVLATLCPAEMPPEAFPDGVIFHSFYGQPSVAVALEQIARLYGEDPLPTPALATQRALQGRQALLVFDGAEEADHLRQALAACTGQTVLITSRRRSDAADLDALRTLPALADADAVAVVQAWSSNQTDHAASTALARICQLVGNLPLALRLVGRYLALHQEEATEYVQWLDAGPLPWLDQGTSQQESVPVLLTRSIAHFSEEARLLLAVIGLLAPTTFDRALLTDLLDWSPAQVGMALNQLQEYGLLVRQQGSYEVSHTLIHTFAQSVVLPAYALPRQRELAQRLFEVFAQRVSQPEETTLAKSLVLHIQGCVALVEQYSLWTPEVAALCGQTGLLLEEQIRYGEAQPLLQQALAIRKRVLGLEHPDTATSLNNLAFLYARQGNYPAAEPLYEQALAIRKRVLGLEHPDTASSLNNLAGLYESQGNYPAAEPLYEQALAICQRVLGEEHPTTKTVRANYGWLLQHREPDHEG